MTAGLLTPAAMLGAMALLFAVPVLLGLLAVIRHSRRLLRVHRLHRHGLTTCGLVLTSVEKRINDAQTGDLVWRDETIRLQRPTQGPIDARPVVPGAGGLDRTGQEVTVLVDAHHPRILLAPGPGQRTAIIRQVIWVVLGLLVMGVFLGVETMLIERILETMAR